VKNNIKKASKEIFKSVVGFRRHIHQYPELSFKEEKTSAFISSVLSEYNIKHTRGWAKHGIVAHIGKGKKCIALRADIDALPILEENDVAYKSKKEGLMHACGHDVHTASMLGTAIILKKIEKDLKGKVKIIFQPGEEKLPGGASIMIEEGVLSNPKPASIIGQHVHPPLEVGKVGVRSGKYMASADEIYLSVEGSGGHAALPQNCVDTILLSAQIIDALQQVVSRRADPTIPTVLSFGKINSQGGATNVIPSKVKIEGTFRTMNEKWRKEAHSIIKNIAKSIAKANGGKCSVNIKVGYPTLYNDESVTRKFFEYAVDYLGKSNVVELPIRMTSEDFSFYSQEIPACFYRLGTGNKKKNIVSPVHTPTFNVDENCLHIGSGLMAYYTYRELLL
jgi:amidohydrolase